MPFKDKEKKHEYMKKYDAERKRDRREYMREYNKKNGNKVKERCKIYRENNQGRIKAASAVGHAIRTGKLTKGYCEICGKEKTDAHHEDYTKLLEVTWLCRKHHMKLHWGTNAKV